MRIVVKVGTSTLTYPTGRMNIRRVETLCKVLSDMKNAGNETILVSSGAIGMGVGKLNLSARPQDMPSKQACAAVGQCELMYTYDKLFSEYSHTVAQILVTGEDLQGTGERHRNFTNTILRLLELGTLPVINENDTVSTGEIAVGDNDTLGALVAVSVKADLLIVLTDIDGLYTADPRHDPAVLVPEVRALTPEILASAGGGGTALSTGGMATKLTAAGICMENGTDMVIVSGERPEILYDVMDGQSVGTRFIGKGKT